MSSILLMNFTIYNVISSHEEIASKPIIQEKGYC
jgi:hypothetical protein